MKNISNISFIFKLVLNSFWKWLEPKDLEIQKIDLNIKPGVPWKTIKKKVWKWTGTEGSFWNQELDNTNPNQIRNESEVHANDVEVPNFIGWDIQLHLMIVNTAQGL